MFKVALHLVRKLVDSTTSKKVGTFSNSTIDGAQDRLKKQVKLAKNGVSQEYIGPPILEKIQMHILTRAELLYPLCYEIPCRGHP